MKEICDAEGQGTVSQSKVSRWYRRFEFDDFSLEDQPRSGRTPKLDNEDLLAALEDEPSASSRDLRGRTWRRSHYCLEALAPA